MTDDVTGKRMVAGFLFRENSVLLVQKEKPSWQRGLLNGIGGEVASGELPLAAMDREFREETSYQHKLDWRHFVTEYEPFGAVVYFYTARADPPAISYRWPLLNDSRELLHWIHVSSRLNHCVGNLKWMIPLALDWRGHAPVEFVFTGDIREKASW